MRFYPQFKMPQCSNDMLLKEIKTTVIIHGKKLQQVNYRLSFQQGIYLIIFGLNFEMLIMLLQIGNSHLFMLCLGSLFERERQKIFIMGMLFQNLQGEQRYYSEIKCTTLSSKHFKLNLRITSFSPLLPFQLFKNKHYLSSCLHF